MSSETKSNFLQSSWSDFIGLIWPECCGACGLGLLRQEKTLCSNCRMSLPQTADWQHADNPTARKFWGRVPLRAAAAMYVFRKEGEVQQLIHNLKYKHREDVGLLVGRMLAARIQQCSHFEGITAIVPVPLHPSKEKRRGYNQSEVIARGMAAVLGVPVFAHALRRRTDSNSLTHLGRIERWEHIEQVFEATPTHDLRKHHILLVDDVITTGATLEACAAALLRHEGVSVSVAALAAAV